MKLKVALAACLLLGMSVSGIAQPLKVRYAASTQPFTPLHSYSAGELGEQVLFFGGIRGQGLHTLTQSGGDVAFPLSVYSDQIYLVDQASQTRYSGGVSHLSQAVRQALRHTGAAHVQIGNTLIIPGGYGPLDGGNRWTTKASMLRINLPAVRDALRAGTPVPESAFTIVPSAAAQVAGAVGVKLGGQRWALVGGSNFTGDYGLGELGVDPFTNIYSNTVAFFDDSSVTPAVPFKTFTDPYWLHRRDLNALPITVNNAPAVVLHGGVFNSSAPWEEPVTIGLNDAVATVHDTYLQATNQYEAASASFYSASAGTNRVVIFGGLSYKVWDEQYQQFYYDFLVPWVDIVTETTYANGVPVPNSEKVIGRALLPTTNTRLVLRPNIPVDDRGQVLIDSLPRNEILLGRVFGGLQAPLPAPDPVTYPSSNVYDVYLAVGVRGDVNRDGVTNFADLNIILGQFGLTGPGLQGDLNLDNAVNFADLNIVLGNFGRNTPG